MKRIITPKRLREYAARFPDAERSLDRWEKVVMTAQWSNPADLKRSFGNVDPVIVKSGRTVYVFNIQGNSHRLVAAIHFNIGMVYVLRLMTHKEYDRALWKDEL
ncbi:MAG: type II toxin-antitoxin system HigB family toxin [Planctomycetes bacterium]|nr:type II toxin-antitoxin system HigB family toxin [Planctomycetota bacterium]